MPTVLAAGLLGAMMLSPLNEVILDSACSSEPRLGLDPAFFRASEKSSADSQPYRVNRSV